MSGAGDSETPSVSTSRSVRPPMGKSGGAFKRGEHRGNQIGIVGGKNTERIADDVIEIGAGKIDVDVPGFFFRARLVEAAAREESGIDRIVARAAGPRGQRWLAPARWRPLRPAPLARRQAPDKAA